MSSHVCSGHGHGHGEVSRLTLAAALLLPALAVLAVAPARAGAQGYDSPTIVVNSFACPDDVAYGDDLFTLCDAPRTGVEITANGPAKASATTGEDGQATIEPLQNGTYIVSDASVDDGSVSLIECRAQEGFGGFLNLPVTYGNARTFTVDLTNQSAKAGTVDVCTWYVLPGGTLSGDAAGLAVDAASTTAPGDVGVTVVPADGTRTPLSGAGPALPATHDVAYRLTGGGGFDQPLVFSVTPDDANAFPTRASYGPILLPPGDYMLDDRTENISGDLTLAAGEVVHAVSVGLDESGAPAAPADAPVTSVAFRGRDLDGAYTDLDTKLYGDEAGALYGADSGYATGTLTFDAGDLDPNVATTVTLLGLDDELAASAHLAVSLNGQQLFSGASTFPAWDPSATGNQWGTLAFDVAPGVLTPTGNTLTIADTSPGSIVGRPPWVMIVKATIAQ